MKHFTINTTSQLLTALAECLDERDENALDEARQIVDGWLISEEERGAMNMMIDAIENAICELHELEVV